MVLYLFGSNTCISQDSLSTELTHRKTAYFISGGLLATGILINADKTKNNIQDWVRQRSNLPNTKVDDYLQYAPIPMMGLYNLTHKVKKSEWHRQTRHFLVSQGLALGITYLLKYTVRAKRPSGGSYSFPSGHTAHVFASAGVLYSAFKDKNKMLALSGYLPAITTAIFRVSRDKHWVSDVVFGAGLGILASHLTYELNIWNSRTHKDKDSALMSAVSFGLNQNGIGLTISLR